MEAGRLILRSLPDIPEGQRIGVLAEHYRSNLVFLMRNADLIDPNVRVRVDDIQTRLEAELRQLTPKRRTDTARQLALRAWRKLVPPT